MHCRLGGYLISQEILFGGDVLAVFLTAFVGTLAIGQSAPSISSLINATGAAGELYSIIRRVCTCTLHHYWFMYKSCTRKISSVH